MWPGPGPVGSDFQLRVGSGWVVNLKVGLSGTLGSGSDKFSEVNLAELKMTKIMASTCDASLFTHFPFFLKGSIH